MAPGQAASATAFRPSSLMPPKWPLSILNATVARQYPRVGSALNWQGQPQS
jgi:hypothetical protein